MNIEDSAVVIDGQQWQTDLPDMDDLKVLVAPWENAAFERQVQKGIKALPPALRADGNVDPAAYYRVVGTAIAKTILFGWENFSSGGVAKPFDAAYAQQLLTDPKYRTFRDAVIAASKRTQLGVSADQTAVVGNLPASSSGSATGAPTPSA